jgi:hypothetical protein
MKHCNILFAWFILFLRIVMKKLLLGLELFQEEAEAEEIETPVVEEGAPVVEGEWAPVNMDENKEDEDENKEDEDEGQE